MSKQQYRTQSRIINDILDVIMEGGRSGVIISKITLKANVSYYSLVDKCEKLVNAGLIEMAINDQYRVYKMTEKGIKFFQEFQKFQSLASSMEIRF